MQALVLFMYMPILRCSCISSQTHPALQTRVRQQQHDSHWALLCRHLYDNLITSLPEGVFRDLNSLQWLWVVCCCRWLGLTVHVQAICVCLCGKLSWLWDWGFFLCVMMCACMYIHSEEKECTLWLASMCVVCVHAHLEMYLYIITNVPCTAKHAWRALTRLCLRRYLHENKITALPEGVFQGLGSLEVLWVVCCCRWLYVDVHVSTDYRQQRRTVVKWFDGACAGACAGAWLCFPDMGYGCMYMHM